MCSIFKCFLSSSSPILSGEVMLERLKWFSGYHKKVKHDLINVSPCATEKHRLAQESGAMAVKDTIKGTNENPQVGRYEVRESSRSSLLSLMLSLDFSRQQWKGMWETKTSYGDGVSSTQYDSCCWVFCQCFV